MDYIKRNLNNATDELEDEEIVRKVRIREIAKGVLVGMAVLAASSSAESNAVEDFRPLSDSYSTQEIVYAMNQSKNINILGLAGMSIAALGVFLGGGELVQLMKE